MVETLQANSVDLRLLIERFNLQMVEDDRFFVEWQESLPNLTEAEMQFLDKVKAGYKNLRQFPPLLEKTVQLSVLSPMLFLANFYLPPYHIKTEKSVEIVAEDEGIKIRGQLDVLLLKDGFWIMAIESKEFAFSMEAGFAQLLAYMLANPQQENPTFGMIATGSTFTFVKLVQEDCPKYAISDQFGILNRVSGLYDAFRVLKRIGSLSANL